MRRDAIRPNQYVVVEADRGEDLGRVTATGAIAERKCTLLDRVRRARAGAEGAPPRAG